MGLSGHFATTPATGVEMRGARHNWGGEAPQKGKDQAMSTDASPCTHLDLVEDVSPSADGCEDCLKTGDSWVHLRMCMECGHVGCCDSSPNRHATQHFRDVDHVLIQSFEPGEDWWWCYADQVAFEVEGAPSFQHT
jgi:uncharacterized UBP type Zn finger protein